MKQAALADKPDVPLAILDDTGDPPNKLAIAVIAVMSKGLVAGSNLSRPLSAVANQRWPRLSRAMLSTESPLRLLGFSGS